MRRVLSAATFLAVVLTVGQVRATTRSMEKFLQDYSDVSQDLLNHEMEFTVVNDFVYKKDLATFTFSEGTIYLLRYVDERPTTALFIGSGNARIEVRPHMELQSLRCVTRKETIDEDFKTCLIRMSDDFDLRLKERFSFQKGKLSWRIFNEAAKVPQGEFFFRPVIYHTYDNYFQLLRSHYERAEDGFFWIDFNRYAFCFDPNQPEEVRIGYEFEGGDFVITNAAVFGRQEHNRYEDARMSELPYPTTIIDKSGRLVMRGLDGQVIDTASVTIRLLVNADSLRFVSTFLHYNLDIDSVHFRRKPVDYHRRGDFSFVGIILPEYSRANDTLELTYFYHGKDYRSAMPYVENPRVAPHSLSFAIPKGYNYLMPGMSRIDRDVDGRDHFTVQPMTPFDNFYIQGYASDFDTIQEVTDLGITLNFVRSGAIDKLVDCFIPDKLYRPGVLGAFNYMSSRLGGPIGTFQEFVFPLGMLSMPGVIKVPQQACVTEGTWDAIGSFDVFAAAAVARQWFGSAMQPRSYREKWLGEAAPEYVALMSIQATQGAGPFYSNLNSRKDSVIFFLDVDRGMPLATDSRVSTTLRSNKGLWLLHMLRFLMFDLETNSDAAFRKFLHELCITTNLTPFTNADIVRLAEKHYGQSLDFFFDQWLYGAGVPKFKVEYRIETKDNLHYITGMVETSGVTDSFEMPVIMRVEMEDGSSISLRQPISAGKNELNLGPFPTRPKELHFNEYFSVLSKDKVKKKG